MSVDEVTGAGSASTTNRTQLKREFTLWSASSLAFAYMSPIVAVYGVFAIALILVGPGFWLAIPIAFAGQALVSLSLGEVASRYPFEGSLYQWAGRLHSAGLGWITGWLYSWTVMIALATVAVGAAGFWGAALDIDLTGKSELITAAILVILISTVANSMGRRPLKIVIGLSIAAEIIGSIGLGIALLFHQVNPFSVIWNNSLDGTNGWTASGLALAIALAGWSFLGFESAGAVAEEVEKPAHNVPRALRYALFSIGTIVVFSCLSLTLAIPDIGAVLGGTVADPVATTLDSSFGATITTAAEVVFAIGFTACALGLQTGISRVIWAFTRDRALPASDWLGKLSPRQGVPINAILVTAVLPIVMFWITGSDVYYFLVNYTIGGWYLTFALVLVAALAARVRRTWVPGPSNLGRWSLPVLLVATAWVVLETVNIAWPREIIAGPSWYQQWAVVLVLTLLLAIGGVVYSVVRREMTFGSITDTGDAG